MHVIYFVQQHIFAVQIVIEIIRWKKKKNHQMKVPDRADIKNQQGTVLESSYGSRSLTKRVTSHCRQLNPEFFAMLITKNQEEISRENGKVVLRPGHKIVGEETVA